ncbi:MAG: AI-2E family transporter [Chloroflexi bacterium]|nr:AI-2E family transporter [Chloroflexota bacterium]
MIGRILRSLTRLPGALWRGTVGRLMSPPPPPTTSVTVVEPAEPRSVAGITFRASLVVVGVVLAAYLLYQLRLLLILVFLAILLAAGLYGVVRFFERFLPRVLAVLISYVLLIGLFALVLFLIFPPLVRQVVELVDDAPRIAEDLRDGAISLIDGIAGAGRGEEIVNSLTSGAQGSLPELGSLLSVPLTLAGILTNALVVIFLSALMLIERDRTRGWALEFVDERDRDALVGVSRNALLRLGAYVRGQLLVMAIIGIGSSAGMLVLGVPFAVPLGALSFATAAIPLAGAFIAGGPIVLVALTDSAATGLLMAAWLVVLQQLEGSVITPYIQGRIVNLSAIAVLLGVVAGTSIAGIVGGIIAIPLVAVADVVLRDIVFPLRRRAEERRHGLGSEAPAL